MPVTPLKSYRCTKKNYFPQHSSKSSVHKKEWVQTFLKGPGQYVNVHTSILKIHVSLLLQAHIFDYLLIIFLANDTLFGTVRRPNACFSFQKVKPADFVL